MDIGKVKKKKMILCQDNLDNSRVVTCQGPIYQLHKKYGSFLAPFLWVSFGYGRLIPCSCNESYKNQDWYLHVFKKWNATHTPFL